MVKILFLGCGQIGLLAHLPALKLLQDQGVLEIAGVCDTDLEKAKAAATQFSIANFGTDWKQMVKETGANAVSLCLPPGINAELSIQALEMGLHVICEKPPGRNVAQAERMATAAIACPDQVTMIAFNRRHSPLYVHAFKESLQSAHPHVFYGRFTRSSLGGEPSNTVKDWITSDGSHALDLAMATIGFPDRLSVSRRQVGADADNVWTIQLHAAAGAAILLFDFSAGRRVERFEWTGPGYDVVLELPDRAELSRTGESTQVLSSIEMTGSDTIAVNYGFLGEYRYFADAIAGNCPRPENDFAYGAAFMTVVQTILDCPSGEMRPIAKPELTPAVESVETASAQVVSGEILERPIVQIMQPPVGQTRFFDPEQLSQLSERCEVRLASSDRDQAIDLSDANVVITGWAANPLAPDALVHAENLKLAIVVGASVKALQPDQLLEREVLICNTADAIAQSVAEHCLMTTLAGLRRLTQVNQVMHEGGWNKPIAKQSLTPLQRLKNSPPVMLVKPLLLPIAIPVINHFSRSAPSTPPPAPPTKWYDLQGQTVGLIGWGYTARHFANLLRPFNCKLLIYSEAITAAELAEFNARRASLSEILGSAKVVSLHKGMTESSRGMLGASELALLRPGSVLVNTARAGLIDESALLERLQRGDIVAALDVFNEEPLQPDHPLRSIENVILSPHNASTTPECDRRVGDQALGILMDWLDGKAIQAISRDRLTKMT